MNSSGNRTFLIKRFSLLAITLFLTIHLLKPVHAGSQTHNVDSNQLAFKGYDPVSYHSGVPEKGNPAYPVTHQGNKYLFSSPENRETFITNPEFYLPAYGGWCAWAMLDGEKVDINPKRFKRIAGVTYLFYDGFWGNTLKKWNSLSKKTPEEDLIKKADQKWKKLND